MVTPTLEVWLHTADRDRADLEMARTFLLLCLLVVYVTSKKLKDDYPTEIFVHPSKGNDSQECVSSSASKNTPCRTLGYAMEHLQNKTQVILLNSSDNYSVNNGVLKVEGKALFSLAGEQVATVVCTNNSGFAFSNNLELIIASLHVTGCGTLQSSTSKNYTEGATTTASFLVAVYVNSCAKVSINDVTITKSEGTAVTMYNSGSQEVSVARSLFADNKWNSTYAPTNYGGGFYIEFTYCEPGVANCSNKTFTKNSHNLIKFDNCDFIDNSAFAESVNTAFVVPHDNDHAAFGRGGGLSFYFKGTAQNNTVKISSCRFANNSAVWGGGLFLEFDDRAVSNVFEVGSSSFENNTCPYTSDGGTGGGGMRIGHYVVTHLNSSLVGNKVTIDGCNFTHNSAMHGGALSLSPALIEAYNPRAIPQVVVSNCYFYKNTAKLGAAIESTLFPLFFNGSCLKLFIVSSSFVKNKVTYLDSNQYELGIGAVYLNSVPAFFKSTVDFNENQGSALAVITCYVDFTECSQASFRKNRAEKGGAVSLLGNAVIQIGQKTHLLFENNHASHFGGAIHNNYIGYQNTVTYAKCFIKHTDSFMPFTSWTSSLSFINNTARFRGQAIYSSSVLPCAWAGKYGLITDVSSFFCQWHFVSQNGGKCKDQIDTLASNMSSDWQANAFPGQLLHLNINVSDDLGHPMTDNIVFSAQVPNDKSYIQVSPIFQYVTNQSVVLTSHGSSRLENNNQTVNLELDTVFARSWHINYTINLFECPLGYELQPSTTYGGKVCKCNLNSIFSDQIWCNSDPPYTVYIANKHWIGQLDENGPLYMGVCPPGYCSLSLHGEGYKLPLITGTSELNYDEAICSYAHREGPLCSQCKENFSIAFGTANYQCINCSTDSLGLHIALYILGNYVPVGILFVLIIVFNVRLTAGAAVSFIFFCQVIGAGKNITEDSEELAAMAGIPTFIDLLYRIPFSVLNLKFLFLQLFGIQVCFHNNFNALDIVQLDALVALSPLLMIIIVIVGLKLKDCCFSRSVAFQVVSFCHSKCQCLFKKRRNIKLSLLHAFAAFILLSYNTFCLSATTLLSRVGLFNSNGTYYDSFVSKYAGHIFTNSLTYQLRYALPAYIVILVFVIPPPLILLGFPIRFFERCIVSRSGCIRRYYPADKIAIFLDTFQGCYRDNMRFFAGLYLVCRLAIFLTASLCTTAAAEYSIKAIIFLTLLVFVAVCQPYREKFLNVVDTLILANLAIITILRSYLAADLKSESWVYWLCYFLIFLPVIYMLGYLLWLVLKPHHKKIATKLASRLGPKHSQLLFDVTAASTDSRPSYEVSYSDDEVEQLLRRAEKRNDYFPSTDCSMETDEN